VLATKRPFALKSGLERVMGIEYIAAVRILSANQMVASKVTCCV
jgi:hypothetical protein